jgi:hypothetical protein
MIETGRLTRQAVPSLLKKEPIHMRRIARTLRVVIIPMAVLSILFGSAVPASAAPPSTNPSTTVVSKVVGPVVSTFAMEW